MQEKKENILAGVIGAVIGVLLGSVLWVVLGQVGFIAGIAGYAIVFCGIKGYEILGKKLSKTGIVICVILSLLAIAGAEFVSLGMILYSELRKMYEVVSLGDAFGLIPGMLHEAELVGEVVKELAIGYILAIWASYSLVKNSWKQAEEVQEPHTKEPL